MPRAVAVPAGDSSPASSDSESLEAGLTASQSDAGSNAGEPAAAPSAEEPGAPAQPEANATSPATATSASLPTELSEALYEEARAGEATPAEEEHLASLGSDWPPTPEAELALLQGSAQVRQTEAAVPATPSQPTEVKMEETVSQSGGLALAEVSQADSDIVDLQSPETPVGRLELPERPLTDQEKAELGAANSGRISTLDQDITEVYKQVLAEVGENESIANDCFNLLLKARDVTVRRDVARLPQAEYYVEQARARVKRASVSAVGARKNAWWIFVWGLIWGMGFVALLILLESQWTTDMLSYLGLHSVFIDPKILLPAMVWGGIGGVIAVWYSLFKHVGERDFDRSFNITYLAKPFFGLVLGATVYMVINLLIVSLGVWPASTSSSQAGSLPNIAPWIIYLLAWACGFKENRIFGLVDAAMKRIFTEKETTTSTQSGSVG